MYKNKKIYNINRRTFLKGLGSLAIPLPLFEFMLSSSGDALADGTLLPKRLLLVKSGNAPAWDGDHVNDITGNLRNLLTPQSFGSGYQLSDATKSLANYSGLQDYIGFFSNGSVPYSHLSLHAPLGSVPAGGISGHMHEEAGYPQYTGRRVAWIAEGTYTRDPGPSGDQLLKAALNPNGQFIHVNYCAETRTPGDSRATMQYDSNGNKIAPTQSPRAIFLQLFSNISTTPTTSAPDPAATLAFNKRKSVLDFLDKERLNFLNRELSTPERTMLSSHLDAIRELETRISTQAPLPSVSSCTKPADPGTDPGTDFAGQSQRIDLIIDLLTTAIACDIVRHGTFRLTGDQCFLPSNTLTGKNANFHDCTHYNTANTDTNDQIKVVSYVVDKFFKFASKLKSKSEGSGNLLDNTALAYISEGGHGPVIDENGTGAHSLNNICTLIAGRVNGIKTGSHVKLSGTHTAKIILTLMKAVGYTGNTLGDISGTETNIWAG
ncbi:MAG: DUF1552 domain-containing protein [Pseudobdellovibrionaceae bacterium]